MQKYPVLVIDDDPRSCELITGILTGSELDVLSAPDGLAGIERARAAQPTVIILDMMMPGVDGIATCQTLKKDPILGDIPVVGITASADLKYTGKAFRAGADFFLSKPFRAADLVRVVKLAVESVRRDVPVRRRQRHPRLPAKVPVRCFVGADAKTTLEVLGHTGNVSVEGLLLWLPEELTTGTALRIWLELPTGTVSAEGTVIWRDREVGDQTIPHGIQIRGFGEDSGRARYRHYLTQIAPGSAV